MQTYHEEAERSFERGDRALGPGVEPLAGVILDTLRGLLATAGGRYEETLVACRAAAQLAEVLVSAHRMSMQIHAFELHTMARLGGAEGATEVLGPRLESGTPEVHAVSAVTAFVVEAKARDALGDASAAEQALECALDLAEPDGLLWPFLLHPAPGLLERHRRRGTAHAALISEILDLLAGRSHPGAVGEPEQLREPLTEAETRVLRYLPTNLSRREIADELYVSVATVKTHMNHVYSKLGAHGRSEAVERARALRLLAPSARTR